MQRFQLWVDKYAPKKLDEIINQDSAIARLREWADAWKRGEKQAPLLLFGTTGTGKTAAALALASDYDFEVLELNASDVRNAERLNRTAGLASVSTTLSGKRRLILLDEIEGLFGNADRGGAGAVLKIIKEAECPIVLTANDYWDMKISSIRAACEKVEFKKIHWATIGKYLAGVAELEKKIISREMVDSVAKNCSGDLRSAINDLQMLTSASIEPGDLDVIGERDREQSVYAAVQTILKTMQFKKSRDALRNLDEDPDFVLKWIDENVHREYKNADDLVRAYEMISRADVFLGRVSNRMNYGFWKYSSDLMSAGVSLAKKEHYHSFTPYAFPSLIRGLSSSKGERGVRKSVALKIAKKTHVSSSTAIQDYIPMFDELMKESAVELTAQFDFEEKELEFFGVKGAKKVIEDAGALRGKLIAEASVKPKDERQKGLSGFF